MKKLYLVLILCSTLPLGLFSQQYLTEKLVEMTIGTPEVQEYFEAFNTAFILSNHFCNNNNCRASKLVANKKVMILEKEDLFMRNLQNWIEFILIKRNNDRAIVKVKMHKNGFKTLKFIQKRGKWFLE